MLIVIWYLVPGLFLFGILGGQGFIEKIVVHLFQILVAKGNILPRPASVYIRRRKAPVVVPDTSPARHSRNGCTYKITRPFPAKSLYPTTPILP